MDTIMTNNKVLSGSEGTVWINSELVGELTSIELKVTGKWEEVIVVGNYSTFQKYVGYSIDGTLKFAKITGRGITLMSNAYMTGVFPPIKIITCLSDVNTGGSERTSVDGVVITEFYLAQFDAKKMVEESLPIKASSYTIIEEL